MNIVVPIKLVPDLVEELTIDESGKALDMEWLRLIINEFDDHAVEQAILLKEQSQGQVTIIAPELEGIDDVLFTQSAKGVDRAIKLVGDFQEEANSHALALAFADIIRPLQPDVILTGVQAHDDLDGSVGPLLAEHLDMPYVGYISGIKIKNSSAVVRKEYPGGLIGEMDVSLPAVLGIQAAEQPPRYVAISKVRQAMKTATLEEQDVSVLERSGGPSIARMYQPETGAGATMIEGDVEEIADRLIEIFQQMGIL